MMSTMRISAIVAATMIVAACSSDSGNDNDFAAENGTSAVEEQSEPAVHEQADTPSQTTEDTETASTADVAEPLDVTDVEELWAAFLPALDDFDSGNVTFEEFSVLLADDTDPDMWEAAFPDGPDGQRIPMAPNVREEDDGTVTVFDCVWDTRWTGPEMSWGIWQMLNARMVPTDDGWKVASVSDPMRVTGSLNDTRRCVPEPVEQYMTDLSMFMTQKIMSAAAPRHAPDYTMDHYPVEGPLAHTPDSLIQGIAANNREWARDNNAYVAVVRTMDATVVQGSHPGGAGVRVCVWGEEPTEYRDLDTHEVVDVLEPNAGSVFLVRFGRDPETNALLPARTEWEEVEFSTVCGNPEEFPVEFVTHEDIPHFWFDDWDPSAF